MAELVTFVDWGLLGSQNEDDRVTRKGVTRLTDVGRIDCYALFVIFGVFEICTPIGGTELVKASSFDDALERLSDFARCCPVVRVTVSSELEKAGERAEGGKGLASELVGWGMHVLGRRNKIAL